MYKKIIIGIIAVLFCHTVVFSQQKDSIPYAELDYSKPTEYTIANIAVSGNTTMQAALVVFYSNLSIGQKIKIPSEQITKAVENLWNQNLFSDVSLLATRFDGEKVYLQINVVERPKLSKFSINGLSSNEKKTLRDEAISLKGGMIINENLLNKTRREILGYYKEKGYYSAKVDFKIDEDTSKINHKIIRIFVEKGLRVKVADIVFEGNEALSDAALRALLKKTKRKKNKINFFASSKFIEEKYEEDKLNIVNKYNTLGYRDANLVYDSILSAGPDRVVVKIKINEGKKYYFRNITFSGNLRYQSSELSKLVGINKGDIFNQQLLDEKLFYNPNGYDISSLYMDDGYLFFQVVPIELKVENDSIDIEIRIFEGAQATYNKITVVGNTKTSDHVILRELRTRPGQKFSRADIQRSLRELSQLGYFDPEQLNVNPIPNPENGTVDVEFQVVEKASDQVELSGGWGGIGGIVGTLGVTFNNFSSRKLFKPSLWNPIPAGDGQRLSLRAQSNGTFFQSYNASFSEPWLGGKKPNSFSLSMYHSVQVFNFRPKSDLTRADIYTTGISASLGKRLKWPDDYFTIMYSLSFQQYNLHNAGLYFDLFSDGRANSMEFRTVLSRNSSSNPIFPENGSNISLSMQLTPPVSLLNNKDYSNLPANEKFKWIEYHKWKLDASWFQPLAKNFVFAAMARVGVLGFYNQSIGYSPFERFRLGGSGLTGFNLYGTEVISQRGYEDGQLSDNAIASGRGATLFNKYTFELRYAVSKNPMSTIYVLSFLEAGNAYANSRTYNPFNLKRAAGVGVRLFLPMFGLLGVDYGYGFDYRTLRNGIKPGNFHFFIGQQF